MNNDQKTILVTGGAGFIGSHLVDALIERGYSSIVVIDDLSLGRLSNLDNARQRNSDIEFYKMDLAVDDLLALRDKHFDIAFHMAVIPLPASLVHPKETVDRNIAMTTAVCEMARNRQIRRLINFSSSEVYGSAKIVPMNEEHPMEPSTPYAASKMAGDAVVFSYMETFGIDAVTVRPFNNYGPRQNDTIYAGIIPIIINRALKRNPIFIFGNGMQTRDFIFAKDTVNAAIDFALKTEYSKGEEINIASGKETSVNELVSTILQIMDVEDLPIEYHPPRPGDVRRHLADITKAKQLINFEPKTTLIDGLENTIKWYKEKNNR
ncbi:MAG: GDP-mannose 4,6-dehydratase [Deltaproteobacteria bacterium]|nr:GDP-mannose 4,6-dehydratase [Deltaproteobacteria bacterium]